MRSRALALLRLAALKGCATRRAYSRTSSWLDFRSLALRAVRKMLARQDQQFSVANQESSDRGAKKKPNGGANRLASKRRKEFNFFDMRIKQLQCQLGKAWRKANRSHFGGLAEHLFQPLSRRHGINHARIPPKRANNQPKMNRAR